LAGILSAIPGLITDALGLLLLIPTLPGAIGAAFAHSPARRADGVVDLPPEQWRRMPDPELPDRRDETPKR